MGQRPLSLIGDPSASRPTVVEPFSCAIFQVLTRSAAHMRMGYTWDTLDTRGIRRRRMMLWVESVGYEGGLTKTASLSIIRAA